MVTSRLRALIADREKLLNRRISYREIEAATRISYSTLSRLGRGRVTQFNARLLDALCEYFECGVGDILQYTPNKKDR